VGRQALLLADLGVAALVDAPRLQQGDQGGDHRVGARGHALGQQLDDQMGAVAIHDQAGEAIGFAEDQPAGGLAIAHQAGAPAHGARDGLAEPVLIEGLRGLPGGDAQADLRPAAPETAGKPGPIGAKNVNHPAIGRIAADRLNRP
jgi:hypothetical protein